MRRRIRPWHAAHLIDLLGDPLPLTYSHTFSGVPAGTLTYFEPSACKASAAPIGTIIVQ